MVVAFALRTQFFPPRMRSQRERNYLDVWSFLDSLHSPCSVRKIGYLSFHEIFPAASCTIHRVNDLWPG
jgi:hypothetical protein